MVTLTKDSKGKTYIITVTDENAYRAAREFATTEGLLVHYAANPANDNFHASGGVDLGVSMLGVRQVVPVTVAVDAAADVVVIDPETILAVDKDAFYSKGKNTPYHERLLRGWPVLTVVDGKVVAEDRKIKE
jgi:hypothetical protein